MIKKEKKNATHFLEEYNMSDNLNTVIKSKNKKMKKKNNFVKICIKMHLSEHVSLVNKNTN